MNRIISNGFEIDQSSSVDVSDTGVWIVRTENASFELDAISDFFRAWLLMERPLPEVRAALSYVGEQAKATIPFPFEKLVGSALKANSTHWTDRAMTWLPHLSNEERHSLKGLLVEARDSKWASQKSRQMARKYVNEIERSG